MKNFMILGLISASIAYAQTQSAANDSQPAARLARPLSPVESLQQRAKASGLTVVKIETTETPVKFEFLVAKITRVAVHRENVTFEYSDYDPGNNESAVLVGCAVVLKEKSLACEAFQDTADHKVTIPVANLMFVEDAAKFQADPQNK